jgi:methionyl-tRNA synthetase
LFRKIEDEEIEKQIEKLKGPSPTLPNGEGDLNSGNSNKVQSAVKSVGTPAGKDSGSSQKDTAKIEVVPPGEDLGGAKPEIVYDDFAKLDLRVGTITSAEKVQKADKLLKLSVDLGTEVRTIVSGIALHFSPEQIVGKQVVVVANLAARKMRGIESQGMILMAENGDGKLHFISPGNIINPGSPVT